MYKVNAVQYIDEEQNRVKIVIDIHTEYQNLHNYCKFLHVNSDLVSDQCQILT